MLNCCGLIFRKGKTCRLTQSVQKNMMRQSPLMGPCWMKSQIIQCNHSLNRRLGSVCLQAGRELALPGRLPCQVCFQQAVWGDRGTSATPWLTLPKAKQGGCQSDLVFHPHHCPFTQAYGCFLDGGSWSHSSSQDAMSPQAMITLNEPDNPFYAKCQAPHTRVPPMWHVILMKLGGKGSRDGDRRE